MASLSSGTNALASSILLNNLSEDSNSASLLLINPRTTTLSDGVNLSGSKVPERSVSYSSRNRSTFSEPNSNSAMASYPPSAYHLLWLLPLQT